MLETNKPFIFSSSTSTTTTTNNNTSTSNDSDNNNNNSPPLPNNTTNELPSPANVLTRPMNNYYYREEKKEPYIPSYQGQPTRLNSAFSHPPEEYAYKPNNNGYTQLLPMSHQHYSSPTPPPNLIKHIKEGSPIYSIKNNYNNNFDADETDSWFDTQYEGDLGDTSRKVKRRKEMTLKMEKLNAEFLEKKERLYNEKLLSIDKELKEAHTHIMYLDGLKDLENMRRKMIDNGRLFREYQKQVTDHQFELEIYQAEEEYLLETQEIREKLFSVLEEKRRKLKEDKDNCDLAYDVIFDSQSRLHKRNLRKRGTENSDNKANKRKQTSGPALVFKLKEEDINTDIQAIRDALRSFSSPILSSSSPPPKRNHIINNKRKQ
ncbi:hypothetical protein G6F37_001901 [Rhizopus arrhizus]|nr:hypothetical protein G6F38_000770 [Rhizopus arrhizus]KAG1162712.1 hypothetical protein G6F37_001901 [Rhizopus arrhizus]